ncbi:formate dehydrogenase accessory sulfurtransferase FdhD [Methylobrevis pamukkalensis]|uniref:Sulfur carrier protein FdhD n=1 Tax=Methylobrevis pamukkalensis TaxID=1439726 RepID=A0A1E3H5X2_9HYPH|nr:formate dehydrogenase accessory sulfurtransferase FdhD [Methylobrevis pamukkalensis]ODN71545.1 formate dehydrogenase accessory protein [Methylobrevis pamukkalensis]
MPEAASRVTSIRVARKGGTEEVLRAVPAEVPVALTHDGSSYAVMLASPVDLEDYGIGFSFTEGVVKSAADIRDLEIVEHDDGLEVRMWLTPDPSRQLVARRRRILGPTGCGLCGVESLEGAAPDLPVVGAGITVSPSEIHAALDALGPLQVIGRETRAVHAAAFWRRGEGLVAVREDVGRHNALDKVVGSILRSGGNGADGMVVLTSRVSVELVQKTARLGASILLAVSAPTSLALRTAEAAGITVVAVARDDAFEIFTHPHRIAVDGNEKNRSESFGHVA